MAANAPGVRPGSLDPALRGTQTASSERTIRAGSRCILLVPLFDEVLVKRLRNTVLLLCPIAVFGCEAAPGKALPPTADMGVGCDARLLNEATVVGVNSAYESALRASDTDALQRVLAPDFLFITSSGAVRDRPELLRSYGAKEVNLKVFTSENVSVRFHGTVGILTADITKEGDYATGPRAGAVFTGRYRFTRVYACGAQGWQLVSTHESELNR
jgi:ketosteroid isomerase-like protein